MIQLLTQAIAQVASFLKNIQVKQVLSIVLIGFFLMTSSAYPQENKALGKAVRDRVHQLDQSDRPKTTGEWNREAEQTADNLDRRNERIGKEAGEAFKQFGQGYIEGGKENARALKDAVTTD